MLSGLSSSFAYWKRTPIRVTLARKCNTHFDENVPVTVFIEGIRVKDLELDNLATAVLVFADEIFVWISLLRVFVQKLHVRVGRR